MSPLEPIDAPQTLASHARAAVLSAIGDGRLEPGALHSVAQLAEQLGVSRTPVREALLMLEREGLVNVEPHRGAIVRSFDAADLLDLYEVRALIEPHAAHRAATRVTTDQLERLRSLCERADRRGTQVADQIAYNEEFHRIVAEAAQSPRLTAALRAVAGIPREFRTAFWANEEQRAQSLFCHRELVSALEAKQPDLAEAVMRMHILGARDFLWRVIHA